MALTKAVSGVIDIPSLLTALDGYYYRESEVDALIGGGGFAAAQTIYVGVGGNDSNDGDVQGLPKLTIGAAITAASALTPASDNIIVISGTDAAEYTEDITVPEYVLVDMPNAHLIGGVTSTTPNGGVRFHRITKSTSGNAVMLNSATAGQFWVEVDRIDIDGTANGVVCSQAAALMANVKTLVNAGTNHGVVALTTAPGHIHFEGEDIYLASTGYGIGNGVTGSVHAHVKHILNTGAGAGTAINADAGTIYVNANHLDVTSAWDIESGATVYLDCDLVEETGSSANDGTLVDWKALTNSAIQPGDNISTLTNDAGYTTGGGGLTIESRDATGGITLNTNTITFITANDGSNVTLPASGSDYEQIVYNRTGSSLTIVRAGADTVGGGTTYTIGTGQGARFTIEASLTNWVAAFHYTGDSAIASAYNSQVGQVSGGEITAGTETALRTYAPADVKSFVDTHAFVAGKTASQVTRTEDAGGNLSGSMAAISINFDDQTSVNYSLTGSLTGEFAGFTGLADTTTVGKVYDLLLSLTQDGTGGHDIPSDVFDTAATYVVGDMPILDTTATTGKVTFPVEARVVAGPAVETTVYLGPTWRPIDVSSSAYQIKPTENKVRLRSGGTAPVLPLGNAITDGEDYEIRNYSGGSTTPTTLSSQTFSASAAIPDGETRVFTWDATDTEWKVL